MIYYQITFKDGSSVELDEQRGKTVREAWLDGKIKMPFGYNDSGYLIGDIKRVLKLSRPDKVDESRRIEAKRCMGKRSIQLEISMRIKRDFPADWPQPMRDKDMREVYRQEIIEEGEGKWCDAIAGTCVCYDKISQTGPSFADVFPGALESVKEEKQ